MSSLYQTRRFDGNRGRSSFGASSRGGFGGSRGSSRSKSNKQYINPDRFIKPAQMVAEVPFEPTNQFQDFAIDPLIMENVLTKGFTAPSRIQDVAIPHGLAGRDVVGIANTGTGKTTAFALPVLHKLMTDPSSKALIVAPTRELAEQIEEECHSFARRSGLNAAVLIGGTPMPKQIRELRANPSLVIGTPGRIKDHLERGNLDLSGFNMVVLDEVDRMVDMGFIADIRFLLDSLHPTRQSLFFSATMDSKIESLVQSFLTDPVFVSVKTSETSDNVEQDVVRYRDNAEKLDKLHDVLNQAHVAKVLVFDETQRSVERLYQELENRGFRADALHGGKSQSQRQRALKRFRSNDITVLVATDVAARGIDVADITHVINYTTPNNYEDYTHRIGRAGRAGRKGYALTFIPA